MTGDGLVLSEVSPNRPSNFVGGLTGGTESEWGRRSDRIVDPMGRVMSPRIEPYMRILSDPDTGSLKTFSNETKSKCRLTLNRKGNTNICIRCSTSWSLTVVVFNL